MLKSLLKAGIITLAGYVVVAMVGVVSVRVYTALAPPPVFGMGNLVITSLSLAMTLLVAPVTHTQMRFHTEAVERGARDAFTFEALKWATRGAVAIGLIGALAWGIAATFYHAPIGPAGLLACELLLFGMVLRNILVGRIQAERRQALYVALLVAESVFMFGATSTALILSVTPDGYLGGHAFGTSLVLMLAVLVSPSSTLLLLRRSTRSAEEAKAFAQKARRYGGPLVPFGLLNWVANLSDRYVLAFVMGPAAVGLYVAPFGIASRAMNLMNGALGDIFRPRLFDAENKGQKELGRRLFLLWIVARVAAAVGGVVAISVAGQLIARLLLAPAYRDLATPVMIWVSAGYGVYGLNMTLENRLMSLNQTSLLLPPLALGAIANVGFSLLLVPLNGIVGAAQATCASFIAQCVATGVTLAIYSIRVARDVSSPENSAAAAEVEMEKEALKAADDI